MNCNLSMISQLNRIIIINRDIKLYDNFHINIYLE